MKIVSEYLESYYLNIINTTYFGLWVDYSELFSNKDMTPDQEYEKREPNNVV